jgi:rhamnose utilization protein RhaD (predicted bifunctional aldolase and dehydrogenase)/NAD(P)-dependent dehydrogenase (short-subunit alcohol dehydrogenase family)
MSTVSTSAPTLQFRPTLHFLQDLWDESVAATLDQPEQLRYRSNLLGSDLRITNFAGGNTSSKVIETDPLTGQPVEVLWVKGSGGDLGSIKRGGFATLYQDKLLALENSYRGPEFEDEMAGLYPIAAFRANPVAASIDTPLHGFLPFPHVDHLHPDWAIALAASANGLEKMHEFNREFNHTLVWVPWFRPGFELGLMMRQAIQDNPGCDGIILGGHGIFTWGETQRDCYVSTITIIDQMGQFIARHAQKVGPSTFGGETQPSRPDRAEIATQILPYLRGQIASGTSTARRSIAGYSDHEDVLRFVNSTLAQDLAYLGTSCPDHFIRTKIRPMFVPWSADASIDALKHQIVESLATYRREYEAYYRKHALPDSPALRDPSPSVVLIPGVGLFSFGKNKTEARIIAEFYTNAIHVIEGAGALGHGAPAIKSGSHVPQAGPAAAASEFSICSNYVALPLLEAFRIEYWALEEAKIRRQPPEKELSRRIVVVVGGGSGIGREVARLAAERGAHVVVADRDTAAAESVVAELKKLAPAEFSIATPVDITSRETVRQSLAAAINAFGGADILINTAALFPSSPDGTISDALWSRTLEINVTANYILADEAAKLFAAQNLEASIVLTSSANAVVSKRGSEAYDVSKAALSHLVRELAVSLAPKVRVNGISPATVVKGSTMFPRDRVRSSLTKYSIPFDESLSDDELRTLLANFYAQRTLTHQPIDPTDCAEAILYLAGEKSRCTSGHLIPVDGGLPEAFLR